MGVLNVTPDSFSDGGEYFDTGAAVARALEIEREGADLLDIGGESTRPGASVVSSEEELRRVIPVLEGLRGKLRIPISIDTSKSAVAEASAERGAEIVNDVTALRGDRQLVEVVARGKLGLILMHMRGEPATMQQRPFARNVMKDVASGLRRAAAAARSAGITKSRIILDPGLGFGKSDAQNFELVAKLGEFAKLGFPLLLGPSRKGFIGRALGGSPKDQRAWGTAALVTAGVLQGAHIVRVHDVREMVQVAKVADAMIDRRGLRK